MHNSLKNYVEAAKALKLHYDLLSFSSNTVLPFFDEYHKEEIESKRKEILGNKIKSLFNLGQDWESCLEICGELQAYYKDKVMDFKSLHLLHKESAEYYEKIINSKRAPISYFYLQQYGKGFEQEEVGEYICKGNEAERHTEFQVRLKKCYPNAEFFKKQITPEQKEGEGQYIFLCVCKTSNEDDIKNINYEIDRNKSMKIHQYNQNNNISIFSIEERSNKEKERTGKMENEFKEMYREIWFFKIDLPLPNIKRKMKIIETEKLILKPIQNATKDLEDKTREISLSIVNHYKDQNPDTNKLSMLLNGTIDAAVQGGILKYLNAFFTDEFIENSTFDDLKDLKRFQLCLTTQLKILIEGLAVWRKFTVATKLIEHLEGTLKDLKEQKLPKIVHHKLIDKKYEEFSKKEPASKMQSMINMNSMINSNEDEGTQTESETVNDEISEKKE
jgi:hypothetical protein